jgi:hypothetical protein
MVLTRQNGIFGNTEEEQSFMTDINFESSGHNGVVHLSSSHRQF